jgi:N-acetyl-anhydromuramyl-L-alanine amidase AmpD
VARWDKAIWQPVSQFSGTLRPIAVCLHHQAGSGNPAPVYASRGVSAHFWIPKSGTPVQHVDTANRAWHGVAHNDYSIGVETEGCGSPPHAEPLTENQLNLFGALMKWANATHGIPLVLSESVTQPGLNYHRCQGGPATGCPCDVRLNARAEILRRAGSGAAPTPPPPPTPTPPPAGGAAPPFPGRVLTLTNPMMSGADVRQWQGQMAARGWTIGVDGFYGNQSREVCTAFQREKGLGVDGQVGPQTWAASWNAPVT